MLNNIYQCKSETIEKTKQIADFQNPNADVNHTKMLITKMEKMVAVANTISNSFAHELRTPLTVVRLYTELLEKSCSKILDLVDGYNQDKQLIKEYLAILKSTVDEASDLVGSLLIQMKVLSGKGAEKKKFTYCNFKKNIEETLLQYPFKSKERDLINFKITKDFVYWGDLVLTNHILFNLIQNSLRAIIEAGKGEIFLTIKEDKKYNIVEFVDTALSIPEENLPKLFKLFENFTICKGTGIGLPFCAMVMDFYQGKIQCLSESGKYTKFILKFPKVNKR